MAKLVNVAVSEAVGSSPLRVRVSLRARQKSTSVMNGGVFLVPFLVCLQCKLSLYLLWFNQTKMSSQTLDQAFNIFKRITKSDKEALELVKLFQNEVEEE